MVLDKRGKNPYLPGMSENARLALVGGLTLGLPAFIFFLGAYALGYDLPIPAQWHLAIPMLMTWAGALAGAIQRDVEFWIEVARVMAEDHMRKMNRMASLGSSTTD